MSSAARGLEDGKAFRLELPLASLEIAGKLWGPAAGIPVLALHGWLDNAASFDRLAPLLPEARIAAVDLPGHGLSHHRPAGVPYHLADWLSDVADIADALGWQRFVLMGHSMGAGIATLFAGALPERLLGLVLLEGLGPLSAADDDAPELLANALRERARLAARRPAPHASRESAADALRRVAGHRHPLSSELLVERGTQTGPGGVRWRHDPRLRVEPPTRLNEEQVGAFLRRIRCPAMLVWARGGYPFDREQMERRASLVTGLVVHELEGGHHVHLDAPELVAPLVSRLLATVRPGNGAGREPSSIA